MATFYVLLEGSELLTLILYLTYVQMVQHVFLEIDAKESLGELWPFTFVRQVIWCELVTNLSFFWIYYYLITS
jgi:hypothetical protein